MKKCPECKFQNKRRAVRCSACGAPLGTNTEVDPLIGTVLAEKFEIQELVGQGAMGRVYLALQRPIQRKVAIKVLHQHLLKEPRVARRFQREAEAASRLSHPNSIAIYDFGKTSDDSLYIAMEYIVGVDLAEVILKEGPLPFERTINIVLQVLDVLQQAHHHNIIHRDLKPDNIMLMDLAKQPDLVKVCDFGIAKIQQSATSPSLETALTMMGMICGTPYYMSPEQAKGEELDGRADLYSVGVILYEMLTGEVPFRGTTPVEVIARHLTDQVELPSQRNPELSIPPALEQIILRAMSKVQEARFPSAEAFYEALIKVKQQAISNPALQVIHLNASQATLEHASQGTLPLFSASKRSQERPQERPSSTLMKEKQTASVSSSASLVQFHVGALPFTTTSSPELHAKPPETVMVPALQGAELFSPEQRLERLPRAQISRGLSNHQQKMLSLLDEPLHSSIELPPLSAPNLSLHLRTPLPPSNAISMLPSVFASNPPTFRSPEDLDPTMASSLEEPIRFEDILSSEDDELL
ncbi:MAG: protein kinase, partial [Myxococcota bacterium]